MKYFVSVVVSVAFRAFVFSQGFGTGLENQTNINQLSTATGPTSVVRQFYERYAGVKGTPYLWESFRAGEVIAEDGKKYQATYLNYNAYRGELIFKKAPTEPQMILSKKFVKSFRVDSTSSSDFNRFKNLTFANPGESGFYSMLYQGKLQLVCRLSKTLVKADYQGAYSAGREYDKFVENIEYYFVSPKNELTSFKLTTGAIANCFPNHAEEIKSFIKKSSLKPKNLPDLIKVFQYIDKLD